MSKIDEKLGEVIDKLTKLAETHGGTDLSRLLEAARDALTFTLSRAEFNAGDNGKFAHAERVLIDIIRIVGPSTDEAKLLAFGRVMAGEDLTPSDVEMYSHHD